MGIALPLAAVEQLASYLDLLVKWNRVYNLTAIRDETRMITNHLLDSLSVVNHLPNGNLVDVGSGAGLPGIPIAISCPRRAVTLLDSSQKKSAFLRQAVAELGLTTTRTVTHRVESYRPLQLFEIVISRAFSDLAGFVKLAGHLCASNGVMIAMKGLLADDEIAQLPASWMVEKTLSLDIPQLNASRHLVFLRPASLTLPN